MAAGAHQDRMLIEPLQGMVDQTDVGMEKEDHGQMMSTGFQVRLSRKISLKSNAYKFGMSQLCNFSERILTKRTVSPSRLERFLIPLKVYQTSVVMACKYRSLPLSVSLRKKTLMKAF